MTAYSPSMIALHDMLRQQLELTKGFLQAQRYMYQSMVASIDPRHNYTTLEDTKQVRQKIILVFAAINSSLELNISCSKLHVFIHFWSQFLKKKVRIFENMRYKIRL